VFHAPERPELLFSGEERPQLDSWLEFCRATLLYKCDGLDLEQLEVRPVVGSALSLLGIIRHMTYVEQAWFERIFTGRDVTEHYKRVDDRDADFHDLDKIPLDQAALRLRPRPLRGLRQGEPGPVHRPALDLRAHDRGVLEAQRPRRPHPRTDRRRDRLLISPRA
jgi:hypothetical protein